MAQVSPATRTDVDHLLERAASAWDGLLEVDREIDTWDWIDQIVYLEEWQIQEDRLSRLAEHARAGDFDDEQARRYRALQQLVAERRPILERLLRS